jgi:hypothetical protein
MLMIPKKEKTALRKRERTVTMSEIKVRRPL